MGMFQLFLGNRTAATPVTPTPTPTVIPSGVRHHGRKYRVRRADFSNQESYELALKAALQNARFDPRQFDDEPAPVVEKKARKTEFKVSRSKNDTSIEVSAASMLALQRASEMDEIELIKTFIQAIDESW